MYANVEPSNEKANILLIQLQSVFTKDGANEHLPDVEHKTIRHSLTDISLLKYLTGVSKLPQNLQTPKASGPDSIPNRILKSCADSIVPGLSAIFQLSLATAGSLLVEIT